MSKLYVNEIYPQSGSYVAVTGNLDVSGTLTAYQYNTIIQESTTYLGSNTFGNDSTDTHFFTGSLYVQDDTKLTFGTGNDASIEYDENGTNELRFAGAAATFEQDVTFDNNVTIGVATTDVTTVTGRLTASQGLTSTDAAFFNANVTLGNANSDVVTSTGQLTASQGLTSTDAAFFNANVTLGNAAADVITSTGQLTASQGLTSTDAAFFNANATLGNANSDVITSTGQLTASQGLTSTDAAFFNANVTLGNANSDVTTVTARLTGSQGAYFANRVGIGTASPAATLDVAGNVLPSADNTHNLGSATKRWANIYTGDLHLKNSRGDWTILEEEDYLCVINNRTNKKYKMLLQELDDGEGE